jgi:hypothetical protein
MLSAFNVQRKVIDFYRCMRPLQDFLQSYRVRQEAFLCRLPLSKPPKSHHDRRFGTESELFHAPCPTTAPMDSL